MSSKVTEKKYSLSAYNTVDPKIGENVYDVGVECRECREVWSLGLMSEV